MFITFQLNSTEPLPVENELLCEACQNIKTLKGVLFRYID